MGRNDLRRTAAQYIRCFQGLDGCNPANDSPLPIFAQLGTDPWDFLPVDTGGRDFCLRDLVFPGSANLPIGGLQDAIQENGAPREDQNRNKPKPSHQRHSCKLWHIRFF
jgi:hypothetical protein